MEARESKVDECYAVRTAEAIRAYVFPGNRTLKDGLAFLEENGLSEDLEKRLLACKKHDEANPDKDIPYPCLSMIFGSIPDIYDVLAKRYDLKSFHRGMEDGRCKRGSLHHVRTYKKRVRP